MAPIGLLLFSIAVNDSATFVRVCVYQLGECSRFDALKILYFFFLFFLVEFLSVASRFPFIYSILSGQIIRFGRDEFSLFSCLFRESKIDSFRWQ